MLYISISVYVVQPGLEPRRIEPESIMLPLHHWTEFVFVNFLFYNLYIII